MSPKKGKPKDKSAAGGKPQDAQPVADSAAPVGPFTLKWTEAGEAQFNAIQQNTADKGLAKQVRKALRFLTENPRHNSLQTHPYQSMVGPNGEKVFEAYAQNHTAGAYRIFFCYGPDAAIITIIAITEHP